MAARNLIVLIDRLSDVVPDVPSFDLDPLMAELREIWGLDLRVTLYFESLLDAYASKIALPLNDDGKVAVSKDAEDNAANEDEDEDEDDASDEKVAECYVNYDELVVDDPARAEDLYEEIFNSYLSSQLESFERIRVSAWFRKSMNAGYRTAVINLLCRLPLSKLNVDRFVSRFPKSTEFAEDPDSPYVAGGNIWNNLRALPHAPTDFKDFVDQLKDSSNSDRPVTTVPSADAKALGTSAVSVLRTRLGLVVVDTNSFHYMNFTYKFLSSLPASERYGSLQLFPTINGGMISSFTSALVKRLGSELSSCPADDAMSVITNVCREFYATRSDHIKFREVSYFLKLNISDLALPMEYLIVYYETYTTVANWSVNQSADSLIAASNVALHDDPFNEFIRLLSQQDAKVDRYTAVRNVLLLLSDVVSVCNECDWPRSLSKDNPISLDMLCALNPDVLATRFARVKPSYASVAGPAKQLKSRSPPVVPKNPVAPTAPVVASSSSSSSSSSTSAPVSGRTPIHHQFDQTGKSLCNNCHSDAHLYRDCPTRRRRANALRGPLECFELNAERVRLAVCGSYEELQSYVLKQDCDQALHHSKMDDAMKAKTLKMLSDARETGVATVLAKINGVDVVCQCDSQSNVSLINTKLVSGKLPVADVSTTVATLTGDFPTAGATIVPLQLGDRTVDVACHVVDSFQYDILLSFHDWLSLVFSDTSVMNDKRLLRSLRRPTQTML